jgi:hypothetical protein
MTWVLSVSNRKRKGIKGDKTREIIITSSFLSFSQLSIFRFYAFHYFFSDLTAEEDFEFKEKCETYESVLTHAAGVVADILPVSERDILISIGMAEENIVEREGEGEERKCMCLNIFLSG